ncbi:hypothetical protein [Streptomyces chiangmaiensis]|uniref:Uncharacterized protein n=1 Tax=Streptomyces chiangmaiensis TaxID=766497 RepID=A0ABU7FT02_9ACTN|nr:hypothetical protein [Streptomyces chiangmaiensis]MED7827098.1 hypothetical protein [Streptomyces chiangmaiensis]
MRDEDNARPSPLEHRSLNLLGRYSFTASTPAAGALRPLRDPDAPELDEDDGGGGGLSGMSRQGRGGASAGRVPTLFRQCP